MPRWRRCSGEPTSTSGAPGLRRFKRREFLRIAARDVLGLAPIEVTERELEHGRGRVRRGGAARARSRACRSPSSAWAGSGATSSPTRPTSTCCSSTTATGRRTSTRPSGSPPRLVREIGATTAEGQTFRIDAALRPEGKQGRARPFARRVPQRTTRSTGSPWEFQSLLRARPGGRRSRRSRQRFLELVEPFVVRDPFPEDDVREIRRVKVRVEQERIPPGEDPQFHLKLGKGALTDVEFTVQLLQLEHCATHPEIRTPGDHRRAAPPRRRRPARPARTRDAARGVVPVLRAGPQRPLPRHRHARATRCPAVPTTCTSVGCSASSKTADGAARRVPARHPARAPRRRPCLLRPRRRPRA